MALILCTQASAQAWPERELTLVVNYGAGGTTDLASRALAKAIERQVGRTVVVENKAGAQGTLGPAHLSRQRPDGYTIGVVTYSTIAPHLMNVPYNAGSFEFIAGYGRFRFGIAVRDDSPYRTLADLVAAATTGKSIFFGATSAPNNLAMFELGRKTGAKFEQTRSTKPYWRELRRWLPMPWKRNEAVERSHWPPTSL